MATGRMRAIKIPGGLALVQRSEEAADPAMPFAALPRDHPDACLPAPESPSW